MNQHNFYKLKISLLFILATICLVVVIFFLRPQPAISSEITKQINYSIYIPSVGAQKSFKSNTVLEPTNPVYNAAEDVLTYEITYEGVKITIAQQATPEVFSEQGVYPAKINSMQPYAEFKSPLGTVNLTRPKEVRDGQVAVINSNSTLLFLHSDSDISQQQWQSLLNTFQKYIG